MICPKTGIKCFSPKMCADGCKAIDPMDAIAEPFTEDACRKAGIPLYWCERLDRYITVPEN